MPLRKSKTTKAKEAVTDPRKNQVSDRTDDLMAALDAAREALARAASKGAELGAELSKEASKAADKLLPERAKQRRREAARRRNRRLLAGTAALAALGVLASRLTGSRTGKDDGGWDRVPDPASTPAASAEVTQLHGNGAGDPARTPPS
jgi:ferric-dicitrate binding protein FerR (iron transport regulator)